MTIGNLHMACIIAGPQNIIVERRKKQVRYEAMHEAATAAMPKHNLVAGLYWDRTDRALEGD
jgi:hypothetical protein